MNISAIVFLEENLDEHLSASHLSVFIRTCWPCKMQRTYPAQKYLAWSLYTLEFNLSDTLSFSSR